MQRCPSPSILVASKHKQKCVFFIRVKQDARRYHQKKIPKNYEETEFICIRISEANLASIFTYVHPRVKKLDNSQIWLCQNWRKREDEREEDTYVVHEDEPSHFHHVLLPSFVPLLYFCSWFLAIFVLTIEGSIDRRGGERMETSLWLRK